MIKEIEIELETVRAMIKLYCINHHQGEWDLCDDCEGLFAYTKSRVLQCPYLPTKPTCGGCKIHCYNQNYRSRIKKVMAYSGSRLIFHSPLLTFRYIIRKVAEKFIKNRK